MCLEEIVTSTFSLLSIRGVCFAPRLNDQIPGQPHDCSGNRTPLPTRLISRVAVWPMEGPRCADLHRPNLRFVTFPTAKPPARDLREAEAMRPAVAVVPVVSAARAADRARSRHR